MKAVVSKAGHAVVKYPAAVVQWRAQVQQAAILAMTETFEGPVLVQLSFELPRPATHYLPVNSRRSEPELSRSSPPHVTTMPDLDKLVRAICDALTDAGVWKDDAQVVNLMAAKRYATSHPRVVIRVQEVMP
jgi:crossover junction endodeoxyribonuclease RusA